MVERLNTTSTLSAGLNAELPAFTRALKVSVVEGLRVLVLRHLAGGAAEVDAAFAAAHLDALPKSGSCLGGDPWQVWIGPTECLLVTTHGSIAEGLLAALRPGRASLCCALDQSAAWLVFELLGSGVDDVLSRLLDASAIPRHAGSGACARFMDISAVVMRLERDRAWLAVERPHGTYATEWIGHVWQAASSSM
jgi:hypothetical protein